jgi:hypothetical protein
MAGKVAVDHAKIARLYPANLISHGGHFSGYFMTRHMGQCYDGRRDGPPDDFKIGLADAAGFNFQ